MNRIILSILLLCVAFGAFAYKQRDLLQHRGSMAEIKASLVSRSQWISYPAYNDRTGWDKLSGKFKSSLVARGETYLGYEWKTVTAASYLEFERSGSRKAMEDPFNANNTALSSLLMAELAEGKGRFTAQIVNGVWHACEMSSWTLSAHLVRQSTGRALPDFREETIDLTSGDLGSFLSWTYYFLHQEFDRVDPVISKRLQLEIRKRILVPYIARSDYWWQAFNAGPSTMVNNWNPWCNFNVLSCFLLMEDNPDTLAAAVYRSMVSVDKFLNYVNEDGACEEGPSYWGHASGKLYDYLQLLYNATGGKISLFNDPMIRNMGEYIAYSYVGNGWVVNFADASAKGGGNAGLIFRYGQAVNSRPMQQFAAYLLHKQTGAYEVSADRDLFRTLENLRSYPAFENAPASLPKTAFTWYPQTQFCYIKSTDGFFLAAKAGYNAESHNHNDIGTFSLYYKETPMLVDAGVGTYTRQTFSNERYSIWTMQSNYHNLPMINGQPQQFGREYRGSQVSFDSVKNVFSADISGAYDTAAAVNKWQRSYTLQPNKGLVITDKFSLKQTKANNQLNFMVWAKPEMAKPGEMTLEKEGKKLQFNYDPSVFEAAIETIPQEDIRLSNVWGKALYRITLKAKKMTLTGSYTCTIRPTD